MSKKDYAKIAEIASEAVKNLPEHLQAAALQKIMDDMLLDGKVPVQVLPEKSEKTSKGKKKQAQSSGKSETLQEFLNRVNPPNNNVKYLGIVYHLEVNKGNQEVSNKEVEDAWPGKVPANPRVNKAECFKKAWLRNGSISTKFQTSITGEDLIKKMLSGENVDDLLKGTKRKNTKKKVDGEEKTEGATKKKTHVKKKTAKKSASKTTSNKPTKKKENNKNTFPKAAGRPGPGKILTALLGDGFFKKPKTIKEIVDYLRTKKGYTYRVEEMSTPLLRLLRKGLLEREQNKDNQYEWKPSAS